MVLLGFFVAEANQAKCPGRAGARPSFAFERESDADINLLSVQVVEDVLHRLTFEWDTVAPPRPQFFDNLEVRVFLDTGDEPAAVLVDAVKQLEIVET